MNNSGKQSQQLYNFGGEKAPNSESEDNVSVRSDPPILTHLDQTNPTNIQHQNAIPINNSVEVLVAETKRSPP